MGYYRANILKENKLALGSVIKDCLITDTLKRNVGFNSDNMLKESVLVSDSVVKNFFITAEEISVVREEGSPIEEVLVCKESLPTASTCSRIAQVQKDGIFKKVRQRWTYSNGSRSSFGSENDSQSEEQYDN